jgi:hypothetical protein
VVVVASAPLESERQDLAQQLADAGASEVAWIEPDQLVAAVDVIRVQGSCQVAGWSDKLVQAENALELLRLEQARALSAELIETAPCMDHVATPELMARLWVVAARTFLLASTATGDADVADGLRIQAREAAWAVQALPGETAWPTGMDPELLGWSQDAALRPSTLVAAGAESGQVFVDGVRVGVSPLHLDPGPHLVQVRGAQGIELAAWMEPGAKPTLFWGGALLDDELRVDLELVLGGAAAGPVLSATTGLLGAQILVARPGMEGPQLVDLSGDPWRPEPAGPVLQVDVPLESRPWHLGAGLAGAASQRSALGVGVQLSAAWDVVPALRVQLGVPVLLRTEPVPVGHPRSSLVRTAGPTRVGARWQRAGVGLGADAVLAWDTGSGLGAGGAVAVDVTRPLHGWTSVGLGAWAGGGWMDGPAVWGGVHVVILTSLRGPAA